MKFMKGVIWGAAISVGAWMIYNETSKGKKNKMIKNGKKFMRSIGMM